MKQLLEEYKREKLEAQEEVGRTISNVKIQMKEATRIKGVITSHLEEKSKICDGQEAIFISLKEETKKVVELKKKDKS